MDAQEKHPAEVGDWPVALSKEGYFHVSGSPMHLMMTAHRLHRANADRVLREYGVDHRTWRLLAQLGEHKKRSIQEIANATGADRTTMSKLVDRAEQMGLVSRSVDQHDRRRNSVALTRRGWSVFRKCSPMIAGLVNGYFEDFEPAEFEEFMRLVKKMRQRVQLKHAGIMNIIDLY